MKKTTALLFAVFLCAVPVAAAQLTFKDLIFPHGEVCPPHLSQFYNSVSLYVQHPFETTLVTIATHTGTTSILYLIEHAESFSTVVRMYNPGLVCQDGSVTLRFWFVE